MEQCEDCKNSVEMTCSGLCVLCMGLKYEELRNKPDPFADVKAFHEKFGLRYDGPPRYLPVEMANCKTKALVEELKEYENAIAQGYNDLLQATVDSEHSDNLVKHLADQFDALLDAVYVALGNLYLQGFDFERGWPRVHAANMAKRRAKVASESKRDSTYDVVKPKGWTAPDLTDLVEEHWLK